MDNARFRGKTALVTGAGQRIGRQIALALADSGANIVIHYRNSVEEAENLRDELSARGVHAWLAHADFEAAEEAGKSFGIAAEAAGKIDFLINSASSFVPSSIEDLDFGGLMQSLQVNAWSPFMMSRLFAQRFGRGKIINLLDTRVIGYDRAHLGYILSKRLLLALTELLAIEFAPGITVNGVAPGLILPPRGKDQKYLEELAATVPLRRHGDAKDVSDAVLYLLGSDFVTGQVIYVDGGRHLAEEGHGSHHNQ